MSFHINIHIKQFFCSEIKLNVFWKLYCLHENDLGKDREYEIVLFYKRVRFFCCYVLRWMYIKKKSRNWKRDIFYCDCTRFFMDERPFDWLNISNRKINGITHKPKNIYSIANLCLKSLLDFIISLRNHHISYANLSGTFQF